MSTTIECIYCREDKPESAYTKVEHVLPQSFGRFRDDNMTLTRVVCDDCFETAEKVLFDIVPRDGDTKAYYTESVPESHRDAHRPVFVLTAAATFSAGEGLAFILQDHGRAEVVGEVTAGAANPGRPYPVNDYFEVVVPNGQVRSAVTGRNWEGVGVIPDIRTTEVEALEVAHRRALQRLLETTNDEIWADVLRKELRRISPP